MPYVDRLAEAERDARDDDRMPSRAELTRLEREHSLPPCLLHAVMQVESSGNPRAVSRACAIGAFQFMPATARHYDIDPLHPGEAAYGAARMYADLKRRFGGNLSLMLGGFNWGPANVARHGPGKAPAESHWELPD